MHADAGALAGGNHVLREPGTVRIRERHVVCVAGVVKRVGPSPGAVDQLVEHDEVSRMNVGRERTGRARTDHRTDSEHPHGPEVGASRHFRRQVFVVAAVARNERDASITDGRDRHGRARRAERSVDGHRFDIFAERVEARTAEDTDVSLHGCERYADFAEEEPLSDFEELDDFESDDFESDFDDELDSDEDEEDEELESEDFSLVAAFEELRLSVL